MKTFSRVCLCSLLVLFLSLSSGFASGKKEHSASPPAKPAKKWRVGYIEGGPYASYQEHLLEISKALSELGWLSLPPVPRQENPENTDKLWAWLAANAGGGYVEFVADAYYSHNWDKDLREKNKTTILGRLNGKKDIDLMISMGTWAGQDMANNEHSVPVVVCSAADPVAAGIVKSEQDSGYDHVHARVDPTRYQRQIRAFHDIIGFKKLGIAFEDSVTGRSYAAMGDIEKVAGERGFEIVPCHTKEEGAPSEVAEKRMVECVREIAPKADSFYITLQSEVNKRTFPVIIGILNAHKVPTFSQRGADQVRQGALLSIAKPSAKGFSEFHARAIGKIINGAKPRDLNQIYETPVRIAFSKAAARAIDLRNDIYRLLSETADEVYDEIE